MWPKAASLLLIVLLSSSLTNGVRRKSKIDLPIANAADAPPQDNIALASSNDATKFEDQPSAQALANTEKPVNLAAAAAAAAALPAASAPAQASAQSNSLPSPAAVSLPLADNSVSSGENEAVECDPDMIGFEIITGYV